MNVVCWKIFENKLHKWSMYPCVFGKKGSYRLLDGNGVGAIVKMMYCYYLRILWDWFSMDFVKLNNNAKKKKNGARSSTDRSEIKGTTARNSNSTKCMVFLLQWNTVWIEIECDAELGIIEANGQHIHNTYELNSMLVDMNNVEYGQWKYWVANSTPNI